jgi:hypothetical protein
MKRFVFPRELLLVEVERRCADPACGARSRVGLTKAEARAYTGFECETCGLWCEDVLAERDVPEWWEELKITGLEGVRPLEGMDAEPGEVVSRMSDAWQRLGGREDDDEEEEGAGDSL